MTKERLKEILRNAIIAYEFELDQQDYHTDDEMYSVLLNEFNMTENEYEEIMGATFAQRR